MAARQCLLLLVAFRATAAYAPVQAADCIDTPDTCAPHTSADDDSDSIEFIQLQRGLVTTGKKALPGPDPRSLPPVTVTTNAEQTLDDEGLNASSGANDAVESITGWISDIGRAVAAAAANASVGAHGPDDEASNIASSITVEITDLSNTSADVAASVGAHNSTDPNTVTAGSVAGWIADAVAKALQDGGGTAADPDGTSPDVRSAAARVAGWMANISRAVAGAAEVVGTRAQNNNVADFGDVLGMESLGDLLNNVSRAVASAVSDLESQLAAQANKTMTIAAARLVMRMGGAKVDTANRLVDGLRGAKSEVGNFLAQIDRDGAVETDVGVRLLPPTAVIKLLIMGAARLMGSSSDELCRSSMDSEVQREALIQRAPEPESVANARIALRDADAAMAMTSAFASRLVSALEDTQTLIEGLLAANEQNNWPHEGAKELQDGLVVATLNVSNLLTTDFVADEVARQSEEKQATDDARASLLSTVLLIVGSLSFIAAAVWLSLRPS